MRTRELVTTLNEISKLKHIFCQLFYLTRDSLHQKGDIPLIIILIKLDDNISKITLNDVSK